MFRLKITIYHGLEEYKPNGTVFFEQPQAMAIKVVILEYITYVENTPILETPVLWFWGSIQYMVMSLRYVDCYCRNVWECQPQTKLGG